MAHRGARAPESQSGKVMGIAEIRGENVCVVGLGILSDQLN